MAEPFLTRLSEQGGILGTLCAILLMAVFFLAKLLLAEKDKRIEDANKNRDNLVEPVRRVAEGIERLENKVLISKGER